MPEKLIKALTPAKFNFISVSIKVKVEETKSKTRKRDNLIEGIFGLKIIQ